MVDGGGLYWAVARKLILCSRLPFVPLALSLLPSGIEYKQKFRLTIFDRTCSFATRCL
jgi:hypothetical protein